MTRINSHIFWLSLFLLGQVSCQSHNSKDSDVKVRSTPNEDYTFNPITAEKIADLFQRLVEMRHPPGTTGVKRAVFLKPHACAKAKFIVTDKIPATYRKGLFTNPKNYDAWLRISSDTEPRIPDQQNSTVGWAVKILDVPGKKVLVGEEDALTQDFLLQNHPVFFVDTADDFLEFTESIFAGGLAKYLQDHAKTKQVLDDMKKPVANALYSRYWSTTPYRFGSQNYAKYSVVPCKAPTIDESIPNNDANYIRQRLIRDLSASDACFELQVQVRAGKNMPLDAATIAWDENEAPFQTVANIKISQQDIIQNDQTCENLSFTAWHALPVHKPVGSINDARGIVYKRLADLRRSRNGVPIEEPKP